MNAKNVLLFCSFCVIICFGGLCESYKNFTKTFINMAVTSNHVYIGGSKSITQLDSSLQHIQTLKIDGSNWLLSTYNDSKNLVECNFDGIKGGCVCRFYTSDTFPAVLKLTTEICFKEPAVKKDFIRYALTRIQNKAVLTITSSDCLTVNRNKCFAVSNFDVEDLTLLEKNDPVGTIIYSMEHLQPERENSTDFKTVLVKDSYVFILFGFGSISKLGKFCTNPLGNFGTNNYEDLPISCTYKGISFKEAQDISFWKQFLFIAFNSGSDSVICKYNLEDVKHTYIISRLERRNCTDNNIRNRYFEDDKNQICYNETVKQCQLTHNNGGTQPLDCPDVIEEFCNNKFSSVEGNSPLHSTDVIYSESSSNSKILKMVALNQEEFSILFVGTSVGNIYKIFLNETNSIIGTPIEAVKHSSVLDIKIQGKNVYVMTEHVVVNVANKENCSRHKTCEHCMTSENINCGWDAVTKSCNQNVGGYFWVPSAGKQCLKIHIVQVGNNDNDMALIFEPNVKVPVSKDRIQTVTCNVGTNNFTLSNTNGGKYQCKDLKLPDTGPKTLSIMYNRSNIVNTSLVYSTCKDIDTCTDCTNLECRWCLNNFICAYSGIECLNGPGITTSDECPRITNTQVLITKGEKEDVTMKVENKKLYGEDDNLSCVIGENLKHVAKVNSDNTSVTCLQVKGEVSNNNQVTSYIHLEYIFNSTYHKIDGEAKLIAYECDKPKVNSCRECQHKNKQGYKCAWNEKKCDSTVNTSDDSFVKCKTSISDISPTWGPVKGGTVITITGNNFGLDEDAISVLIYGVECKDVKIVQQDKKITCTTGDFNFKKDDNLVFSVYDSPTTFPGKNFNYKFENIEPEFSFYPNKSIKAGGKKITVKVENVPDFGQHKYDIEFCDDHDDTCFKCIPKRVFGSSGRIQCLMEKSDTETTLTKLNVTIDSNTVYSKPAIFEFVKNPTISHQSSEDATVFKSGGAKISIKGTGFLDVGEVYIDNATNHCDISTDYEVLCNTPPYVASPYDRRRKRSVGQNAAIYLDGYQDSIVIYYVEDPTFESWDDVRDYNLESTILIKGSNLLEGAKANDYIIQVGLDGKCIEEKVTNENITCLPPKTVPRTHHSDEQVVLVTVQVGRIKKELGYIKYVEAIALEIILIAVLSTLFVLAVVIGVVIVMLMRHKKRMAIENFQMELVSREEKIREASREEFADAQMTIRDIKSDIVTSKIPYFDYQTYVFYQLFPNQEMETHPLLHDPMITDDNRNRVKEAMDKFHKLMTNKLFLKSLVQALENMSKLTMKDKANFASLLSVAVMGNMRLFYELVSSLLNEMVQSASKKQQKVLFRRFESITQRLMVNWLEITLYDHLKNQSGMQLFMLYKATQTVIEKGPIDAVTHNCRNTLAEERLLKNRVEYENLTLEIDLNGTGTHRIPVSVLDCDTISQVKQKCITAIYKNKPASEIPTVHDLDLEWHHGRGGKLILQDIDNISDRSNGMIRLNTIKHYMVKDGSEMALLHKDMHEDDPNELYANQQIHPESPTSLDHVKLLMPDSGEDSLLQWHLSNLTDEEKSNKDHEIGEIFLNRLFHTKLILRDYIDACFEGILDAQLLSVPVRYFLCMIDKLGKDMGVDSDVLQSWKSECYATRVWASLIAKPQILFDVAVPSHVEPCMDILKQVFIDSFTQGTQTVTKDASTQKLLFYKDVPEYRKKVNAFFLRVELVTDQDFWRAMEEISNAQSSSIKFSRQATLQQLYNFIAKYKEEILDDFSEKDEPRNLELGKKLEEIIDLMEDRE